MSAGPATSGDTACGGSPFCAGRRRPLTGRQPDNPHRASWALRFDPAVGTGPKGLLRPEGVGTGNDNDQRAEVPMSDEIQVGDRVRSRGGTVVGEVVTKRHGVYVIDTGDDLVTVDHDLTKIPTFPEWWINVYADGWASVGYVSRRYADQHSGASSRHDRLGVIHLHPDGTVEMEAP